MQTKIQTTIRRLTHVACAMALAVVCATALAGASHDDSDRVRVPPMPDDLRVPEGNRLVQVGHAFGTQNYICLPSATSPTGFAWTLFGPQANLFTRHDRQIMTHFLSPNPDEAGTLRATWQDSDDTSAAWARAVATSIDSAYVEAGAIPWLKLQVVGTEKGPTHGRTMMGTTFIQRLNTTGGAAPATGCAVRRTSARACSCRIPRTISSTSWRATTTGTSGRPARGLMRRRPIAHQKCGMNMPMRPPAAISSVGSTR